MKLFCTKIKQRASTRLERYRCLVQKLRISWNIRLALNSRFPSCSCLTRQKKALLAFQFTLPHFLSALCAFYSLLQKLSSLFLLHFYFCPAARLVSPSPSHCRETTFCVSLREAKADCVVDTNLDVTRGSKCAAGHPAGLGLNRKMTQCDIPVKTLHKFSMILCFSHLSLVVLS